MYDIAIVKTIRELLQNPFSRQKKKIKNMNVTVI